MTALTPEAIASMVAEAQEATEKWPFDDYTIALAAEVSRLRKILDLKYAGKDYEATADDE
jgi:hypothetical protein